MSTKFIKPNSIQHILELLDQFQEKAAILNGGTDLVEAINVNQKQPEILIYIADLEELRQIVELDGKIVIGGAVTVRQALESPVIKPILGLVTALKNLGSPPIQEVATLAGNLGTASTSADGSTMLMALETKIVAVSLHGERIIPIEEFFLGRKKHVLKPNELIREIYFESPVAGSGTGYIRLARRKAQDIAKILIGVNLQIKDGKCAKAAIGLGALNPATVRSASIEQGLIDLTKNEALRYVRETFPEEAGLRPSRFTNYKEKVVTVAVQRAVQMAWDDAERSL